MKILVTGGAGYIGSIMVPRLLEAGHEITVVDNFFYGQNSLAHCCHHKDFQILRGDIRNQSLMKPLVKDADAIIPLAALVGAPICDDRPLEAHSVNHDAAIALMDWMSSSQMILMPTTNSGYGGGGDGTSCDEESPLNPISQYAKEKVHVEQKLMTKENAISFRLATVFGMSPKMRLDLLVNDFTYRAVSDKFVVLFESHFKRNYIHVQDVARVFLHGLENFDKMKGQIYNVGLSDANLSKEELCNKIKEHYPDFMFLTAPVGKDPDQRNYIVSNEKIERTGFKPQFSLSQGVKELVMGLQTLRNGRYTNLL